MSMSFEDFFNTFTKISSEITFEDIPDKTCLQLNLVGKDSGSFYMMIEQGKMTIHSGEYKARQVLYIFTPALLGRILNGVMDPVYAYTTGRFQMLGDIALGRMLLTRIVKAYE